MISPAIETRGLTRRFGSTVALRDLSLTVAQGGALLVVGHNGAGKTTLLRVLATALRPTAGWGRVFGRDLVREADAVRAMIAYVSAAGGVYLSLTGRENLAFAAALAGEEAGRPRLGALLERAGLAAVADRPARAYSQGMRRRLALARAFLLRPRLLLIDDPFGGLDAEGSTLVEELVAEAREAGGAALLATHDWERGLGLADRVLVLAGGRQAELSDVRTIAAELLRATAGGRP